MENNFKIDASDIMIDCFIKMAGGPENLVRFLAQGNGKALFENISQNLGNDNAQKLFDDNVNTERLMLSTQAYELKKSQENNDVPIM